MPNIKPVTGNSALRFGHYDQMIIATVAGQGIAFDRIPLIKEELESGELSIPFKRGR